VQKFDIRLPPDDPLDVWDFTRLIAKSIHPSLREAKGHAWIRHKLELVHDTQFETCRDITAQERETLLRLLPGLPPEAGMSEEAQAEFMDAFMKHPERPSWRPVFVSDYEVTANAFEITRIQEQHLLALNREIAAGNIHALNGDHIAQDRAGARIFIVRADALRYLAQKRLRIVKETHPATLCAPESQPEAPHRQPSLKTRPPSAASGTPLSTQPKASDRETKPRAALTPPLLSAPAPFDLSVRDADAPMVIIRRRQVEARTSLSRSAIYDRLDPHSPRYDATFPKQLKLGSASVGWLESEIDAWLSARIRISRP
jgi:predicted DNA-binding transcriptional regulator AlpA